MDVESVLQSVQERDKWRHRLETLQRSLHEVTEARDRVQRKLRRLRKDLRKLQDYSEAVLTHAIRPGSPSSIHANPHPQLTAR